MIPDEWVGRCGSGACAEVLWHRACNDGYCAEVAWTKACISSNRVEVHHDTDAVWLRDSKDPDGPVMVFSAFAWVVFCESIHAGHLPRQVVQRRDGSVVVADGLVKLMFDGEEWGRFVIGVRDGTFTPHSWCRVCLHPFTDGECFLPCSVCAAGCCVTREPALVAA